MKKIKEIWVKFQFTGTYVTLWNTVEDFKSYWEWLGWRGQIGFCCSLISIVLGITILILVLFSP
jgi:hypothetical protein